MLKVIPSVVLLSTFSIVTYSFLSFNIIQATSTGILPTILHKNGLVEHLYIDKISQTIITVSKQSQPPFLDPNNRDADPFLPTEKSYCSAGLVGMTSFRGYTIKSGTNDVDVLDGTPKKDLILGLDGDDVISGLEEGDIICGGKGNDVIRGEMLFASEVRVYPPSGKNLIFGQEGDDTIRGGAEDDSIIGGPGNDHIIGGFNSGDDGNDSLQGGQGNDLIEGDLGNDKLYGGSGNDELWGGSDFNINQLDGGPDFDKCHGNANSKFINCELTP